MEGQYTAWPCPSSIPGPVYLCHTIQRSLYLFHLLLCSLVSVHVLHQTVRLRKVATDPKAELPGLERPAFSTTDSDLTILPQRFTEYFPSKSRPMVSVSSASRIAVVLPQGSPGCMLAPGQNPQPAGAEFSASTTGLWAFPCRSLIQTCMGCCCGFKTLSWTLWASSVWTDVLHSFCI